jgi:retinol dehydrogenase-14
MTAGSICDPGRIEDSVREIRATGGGRRAGGRVHRRSFLPGTGTGRLADEVLHTLGRVDVLVNNVGGYWNTRHVATDGLEHTFALDHLAAFLL